MAAVKIGVLGGTFDPPHLGHLLLAEQAREQLALERVLWAPAGAPWRKEGQPVSNAEHRLEMARLAIAGNEAFVLSDVEVAREGPTYTVDTLAEMKATRPDDAVYFIAGQDALQDLPNWREPERLISLATLAVAGRGDERPDAAALEALVRGLSGSVVWLEMPRIAVSASEVRRRAAEGRSLRYLTPDAVAAYISEHGLYRR